METRFPTSFLPLATVRLLFGLLLSFSAARFLYLDWVDTHYANVIFHPRYPYWEWLPIPTVQQIYWMYYAMIALGVMVAMGFFYRFVLFLSFIIFTWVELIDAAYYLNHYYFVSLTAFLLVFMPAHHYCSLDAIWLGRRKLQVNYSYYLVILRVFVGAVYFFAGLAKFNEDWIFNALPLRMWLPAHGDMFLIGPLLSQTWIAFLFGWIGALFDTTVPFFLMIKKTRPWAFVVLCIFHILTGLLFPIGVFPIVMIAMATVFFSGDEHRHFWSRFFSVTKHQKEGVKIVFISGKSFLSEKLCRVVVAGTLVFHLVFPLRSYFVSGNIFWHERGYRFSWRVMLMEKSGELMLSVKDLCDGSVRYVHNADYLTRHQEKQISFQPDLIIEYARYLNWLFHDDHPCGIEIYANAMVTLNGRPSRPLIYRDVDLLSVTRSTPYNQWVTPADH